MNPHSLVVMTDDAQDRPRSVALGDRACRWLVLAASIVFGIAWTLALGKALHWDAINYHFYLGFAALNDRFALDFFAAGTPSYINPYAYVPLYLLTSAGVPAVAVVTILAALHSLILWLTYELALVVSPSATASERQAFAIVALVLAALSPVLLQGLGMTLVDVPLGALVVAGWLALAKSLRHGVLRWVALGAVFGGLAAGLKLSNALYAAAALSMVAFFPGSWRRKLIGALVYGAACGLAFVAISGPWSLKLWQAFGNPLFPLLNDIFQSPDFTSASLRYERFRPATFWEFANRPFEMMMPMRRQHTEGSAPDLRFAALFIALVAAASPGLQYVRARGTIQDPDTGEHRESVRILSAVTMAFVVAWCLWLKSSGNSRYFVPMGCVASVLLAAILHRAYRRWKDPTLVGIALIVLAQAVQIAMGSDWRRNGDVWAGPLLPMQYPDRFRNEPYLFLSTSFLSGSAFLSQWHPESGMITISGFYTIGPDRPGWDRARDMIAQNADRMRLLTPLPKGYDETTGLPGPASHLDVYVRRFGLAVDADDCAFVKAQNNFVDAARVDERERWTTWVTCRLLPNPAGAERYIREVRGVDVIFDRVEATCPNLFHPPRPVTEQHPNWTRLYNMGSEIQLWIADGRLLYRSPFLGGDPIDIGTVEAWSKAPQRIDCSRKYAPAFGGLAG